MMALHPGILAHHGGSRKTVCLELAQASTSALAEVCDKGRVGFALSREPSRERKPGKGHDIQDGDTKWQHDGAMK
jgi:hypothetical protein